MFTGSITALISPFRDEKVDETAFAALVEWQIAEGSQGLVPCGTTGEAPTLSEPEQDRLIAICVEVSAGRAPVIAGTGGNSTSHTIQRTLAAKAAGVDGALVVTPYYSRPSQEGLYRHFAAIAEAAALPIVIYNIPGRSAVDMSVATMARLSKLANIIGVKDATGDAERTVDQARAMGPGFCQLSGDDKMALGVMANGGHGCISVTANVAPRLCADFMAACLGGDFAAARALQDKLWGLHTALFLETSPGPVKFAVSLLGRSSADLRLPLAPIAGHTRDAVRAAMAEAGLLS